MQLEKWSLIEESVIKQKSRVQWMKLWDSNTKYFTAVVKEMAQRKHIHELTALSGTKLTEPKAIIHEVILFYKGLMGTAAHTLPALDRIIMYKGPQLTHKQKLFRLMDVIDAEIKDDLWAMGEDKALGVACPVTIKECRPIACCTVLYKSISKILACRLQSVISSIICEAQASLVPGRKIVDNIILAHELVKGYTRKNISPWCIIKVDLKKAYDSVEWIYLEQVMDGIGFPTKFTNWIMECVRTVNYSVLVNGEPT
ncbi:uncharacterized protein LOC132619867 [Lycium barbarum]|uniref:uncharacterized protein LOC132619867 n=1 Tax=Lycium barbarum TaxID=112863 RepID=UPI00293EC092|nr:uncharacterized protein LOC132619867 [Lycium barbarum]